MPLLRCHNTTFYSHLDEALFFSALNQISAVKSFEGKGRDLLLSVPTRMSRKAFHELNGLFIRYKIDRRQLDRYLKRLNRA